MIKVIAEHSVDVDLLTGGICIDVGCRGFQFSEAMRDLGCEVVAFDLEDMVVPNGIKYFKAAVTIANGGAYYVDTKDPQAKYLSTEGIEVNAVSYVDLFESYGFIDVLKLDCEGGEYFILSDPKFQPVPRQISVEFHLHCHKPLHKMYYDKCMENLVKHYEPVKHELTQAHGAGWNYWDSLFIRKDLL